jgi:hypothetical protein
MLETAIHKTKLTLGRLYVEQENRVNKKHAEKQKKHLEELFDLSPDTDEVVWDDDNAGMQSQAFDIKSDRWKGRPGTQPPMDPHAKPSAHVKTEPPPPVGGNFGNGMDLDLNGALARALDATRQMTLERSFLRAWHEAVDAGELVLPADSLLVVPRLFEELDEGSSAWQREEDKPTVLVTEDLVAAGFLPTKHYYGLENERGEALAVALADFHAGCWQIRDRLHRITGAIPMDTECTADEADTMAFAKRKKTLASEHDTGLAEIRQFHKKRMTAAVKQLRSGGDQEGTALSEVVAINLDGILEAMDDRDPEVLLYCHNDPWAANTMFRFELDPVTKVHGRVNGVALVDFGSIGLGSPVADFIGFMRTSLDVQFIREPGTQVDKFSPTYVMRLWPQLPEQERQKPMFTIRDRAAALAQTLNFFAEPYLWQGSPSLKMRRVHAFSHAALLVAWKAELAAGKREEMSLTPQRAAELIRVRKFHANDIQYVAGLVGVKGTPTSNVDVIATLRDMQTTQPSSVM